MSACFYGAGAGLEPEQHSCRGILITHGETP